MKTVKKLKKLKQGLKDNNYSIGTWLQIPNTTTAEILSSSSSFDWVCIDLEHSPISIETCENMIRSIEQSGSVPFVRLYANDETLIKRVMDSGALGIIVPMISSLDCVKKAYESMHYPPVGKRGVGLARVQGWGNKFEEYKNEVQDNILLIGQIETKVAVDHIDEIFKSGLLDAYIIGPYDLSASYGAPGDFKHKEFLGAINKITSSAKENDVPSGYHLVDPDENELNALIKEGYSFIAYGMDTIFLKQASKLIDY